MRAKQGRVVKTGKSQRSSVLSGKPKTSRLLVSVLIKTHRIMVIKAIYLSLSNEMSLMMIGICQVPLHVNLLSKPWYAIKEMYAHFANCCYILAPYFLIFTHSVHGSR